MRSVVGHVFTAPIASPRMGSIESKSGVPSSSLRLKIAQWERDSAVKGWDSDVSHAAVSYKAADGDTITHTEMRTEKATAFDAVWRNLDDNGSGWCLVVTVRGHAGGVSRVREW
ncbi:hypothetical protein [Nonomuraea turkmeniaca]|uniref:hypothetical protein n=1 Tax=Nonomuraea turkmeniaca TaxID=103838 RepID=UPI001B85DAD8|nr:hypothetical protein [Nonomuraea turkmeniaca]